jgi:hypothetical protein
MNEASELVILNVLVSLRVDVISGIPTNLILFTGHQIFNIARALDCYSI